MSHHADHDDETELKRDFLTALEDDRTLMLGLTGVEDGATRPMTAQIDRPDGSKKGDDGTIYFFASKHEGVGKSLGEGQDRAIAAFQSKDHKIFASIHGRLVADNDRTTIDRLWSPFAAMYYKDGKDDPNLLLIRFDTDRADLWRQSNSGFFKAVAYKLMGKDAGEANPEDRAEVAL